VTVDAVVALAGPAFDVASVTAFAFRERITVPWPPPERVIVKVEPDEALTPAVQPVAVPVIVKSLAARPLTVSPNATVYCSVVAAVGEVGGVIVGATGPVRSTVTEGADDALAGLLFPAGSVSDPAFCASRTVPLLGLVPLRVTVNVVPLEAETDATVQGVDVPVTLKSEVASPVTDSLKVSVYARLVAFVGVDGAVNELTVAAVRSIVTAGADEAAAGPVLAAESATDRALSVRTTVPAPGLVADAVTVNVVPLEAETDATDQPVEVPLIAKSLVARPVIDSLNVSV
jgi:hypothetical protein